MVMPLASHVAALLEALKAADFEVLAPAERERFADLCRHWANVPVRREPKSGALTDLQHKPRDE
jgi:hypothetical protein